MDSKTCAAPAVSKGYEVIDSEPLDSQVNKKLAVNFILKNC